MSATAKHRALIIDRLEKILRDMREGADEPWYGIVDLQKWSAPGGLELITTEEAFARLVGVPPRRERQDIEHIEVDEAGWRALGAAATAVRKSREQVLTVVAETVVRWYDTAPEEVRAWVKGRQAVGARGPWDRSVYRLPWGNATRRALGKVWAAVGPDPHDDLGFDLLALAIGDPDVMRRATGR